MTDSANQPDTGFVRHAKVVSGLTLVSRLTGLVRDGALAATMGMSAVSDAFFLAFLVPNLFRRLFGEGALTAALVPIYSEWLERDRAVARQLASAILLLLAVGLGVITLLCEAALFAALQWTTSQDTALALKLMMIMLPYMPLVCGVAVIGGVLQVHKRFGVPAAVPVVLNGCMIGAAALAAWQGESAHRAAFWIAGGVVVAGVLQLALLVLALLRVERITFALRDAGAQVKRVLWLMLPMALGLAVFQVNTLMDGLIAFFLSPKDGSTEPLRLLGLTLAYPCEVGAVAALQWSQRLYQFPLGVFGIAIATAIFPALARAAAKTAGANAGEDFMHTLRQGMRLTVFIALPASAGLMIVGLPLARLIYQHGRFELDDAQRVALILTGYAASVWAYSMTHVLTRAYHARQDAKTPLRITLITVVCNLALNLVLIWPFGALGLALSTATTAVLQCVLLTRGLHLHTGEKAIVDGWVLRGWGRAVLLTGAMALALLLITRGVDLAGVSEGVSAAVLAGLVVMGAAVYGGGAVISKAPEVRWLLRR